MPVVVVVVAGVVVVVGGVVPVVVVVVGGVALSSLLPLQPTITKAATTSVAIKIFFMFLSTSPLVSGGIRLALGALGLLGLPSATTRFRFL